MSLRVVMVDRGPRRRAHRRAYHRAVVDVARGHAFIGRTVESERLAATYTRVAGGESWLALVAGEAGIGKSRLVERFGEDAARLGARVLVGGCLPLGTGGLPYAPFVEAFRALLRDVEPGAIPALLGPNRGELARLMPEIRARPDQLGGAPPGAGARPESGADERFAQGRLFELVLGVVERLTGISPVVLVIEDLQWADPSTRDLLAFLVRNLREERALIVATLRTDELDPRHAVASYVAELERAEHVDRIDLERFDRVDLARLLADELGSQPESDLVDRIWERTAGNPFYAEQVLAASRERVEGDLPPRLRDVVLARMAAVSEQGQEILRVASAAGSRIDDDLLATVADTSPQRVHDALREVVDRRILVPAGGVSDPHLEFRHALLREVIHGELFPGERARYHARFAAALESRAADRAAGRPTRGPAPSAAELAYHWDAAGDDRRALAATIVAARDAERGYAWLDAHRRFLRALELADRVMDGIGDAERVEVLVRAAETAVLIGDYATAVEFGQRAIASVDPTMDPDRAATLLERQRWYLWEAGDRVAAAAAVAAAERLVPKDPPSTAMARILAHHAGLLMYAGRLAESVPIAEAAIEQARTVGSSADEALALGILGSDLALLGRVDEGVERFRAGIAIAEALHSAEGIALGASNLAILLDRVGRPAEALDVAVDGYRRAGELGVERTYGGLLLAIAAKAAFALGRWDEADGFLTTGLDREPIGTPGIRLRIQRARLDIARGDLPRATAMIASARAADEARGGTDDRAALVSAQAELAAIQGHVTETRAAVAEGFRMAANGAPPDPSLGQLAATGLRAEADAAAGARARRDSVMLDDARRRAGEITTQVERIATMLGVPMSGGQPARATRDVALTTLCRAEARRVDDRDVAADWSATATAWEAIGRPYPAAYARYRLAAAILRDHGQRSEAREALVRAGRTATHLRAQPLLAEVDRLAHQARLDLEVADPTTEAASDGPAGLGLTERELEVLRLIAAGWSNQEIADALFISRKTASVHASHIFDKLGAGNRSEAAAIAHRLGLAGDAPVRPGSASTSS